MFGTFRMALAIGVVLAHMGIAINGVVNTGVVGVVCFFMVSGYAMSALLSSSFPTLKDAPRFYADRFLRIAPQYYFYLAICAFTVLVVGWKETSAQDGPIDALNITANLTILPLFFAMHNNSIGSLILNLPTWSIALELCFYLLLPWLLTSNRTLYLVAAIGAVEWAIATHGVMPADPYAYRMLPATLVFFLTGVAVQRRDPRLFVGLTLFFAADAASVWLTGNFEGWIIKSLFAGAAVGLVAVPILSLLPRNAIDEKIGAASYGAYLSHWIFVTTPLHLHRGEAWAVSLVVALSIVSGWASYRWIEAPTVRLRKAMRGGHASVSSLAWKSVVTSFHRVRDGTRWPASGRGYALRRRASDRRQDA